MQIREIKALTDEVFGEIDRLHAELSIAGVKLDREKVEHFMHHAHKELYVVDEGGHMAGMATVQFVPTMRGCVAHVDDVVVEEASRGKGYGRALMQHLIDRAREKSCYSMEFTSRPSREAANALYQKMGFEKYDTNVYRMRL